MMFPGNPLRVPIDTGSYFFTSQDLARLTIYRNAVAARFYNEALDPPADAPQYIEHLPDTAAYWFES